MAAGDKVIFSQPIYLKCTPNWRDYTYDANNRLKDVAKGGTSQISYTYDKAANVLTVTDVKGFVTTYTYDKANRMGTVSYTINGSSKTTTYTYDLNGNRQSIAYPGGITESYQYDKNNRLLTLTNTSPFGTVSNYIYTYYDNGLQKTKTDSYGLTTYVYDVDGRIKQITGPGKTTVYTYDNAGNRQTMDETYTSDQFSGYIDQASGTEVKYAIKHSDYVYSDTNALMQMTETMKNSAGTEVLSRLTNNQYDHNGNQLSQESDYLQAYNSAVGSSFNGLIYGNNSTTFDSNLERTDNTYDGFNRLIKVDVIKSGNRVTSEFAYNGDDLRIKKEVKKSTNNYTPDVTNYLYDGQYVILETDASSNVKVRYLLGVNYIGRVDASNKLSYFMYNGHGDVVQTIAENGTVENQYDYDIWGNPTLTIEPLYSSAIRYAGEFYDNETGLYYLRARYYDPMTARFMSEDTYLGDPNDPLSLNLYTYCINNPILYFDPSGHWYQDENYNWVAQSGDTLSGLASYITGNGDDWTDLDYGGKPENLQVGEAIDASVWNGKTSASAETSDPVTNTNYTVQPGDTLGKLAKDNGTTVDAIANANNISNPDLIYAGENIVIPSSGSTTASDTTTNNGPTTNNDTITESVIVATQGTGKADTSNLVASAEGNGTYHISGFFSDNVKPVLIGGGYGAIDALSLIFLGPVGADMVLERWTARLAAERLAAELAEEGVGKAGLVNLLPANGRFATVMPEKFANLLSKGKGYLSGNAEAWITAADDLKGINTVEGAASRLTLVDETGALRLQGDVVVEFNFKNPSGLASPYNRLNPGFVNGGRTLGGAREWLIPSNAEIDNIVIRSLER